MPSSGPDRLSHACSFAVCRRDARAVLAILLSALGPACVRSPPQLAGGEAGRAVSGLSEGPRASLTLLHVDDLPEPFALTALAVELDEAPATELRLDDGELARGAENVAFHGAIAPGPHRLRVTLSYRVVADEAWASGLERTVKLASSLPFEAADGTRTVVDLMALPTATPPSVESPPKLVFVVGVEPLANPSARRSLICSRGERRARHARGDAVHLAPRGRGGAARTRAARRRRTWGLEANVLRRQLTGPAARGASSSARVDGEGGARRAPRGRPGRC
jgi:hypothetical protein